MTNLAPSARDFIADFKDIPNNGRSRILTPAVDNLPRSEFDWSGSSLFVLLFNQVTNLRNLVAEEKKSAIKIYYFDPEEFEFDDLKKIKGSPEEVSDDLLIQREKIKAAVPACVALIKAADAAFRANPHNLDAVRKASDAVMASYFKIMHLYAQYNMTLVEWLVQAMAFHSTDHVYAATVNVARATVGLGSVSATVVRDAELMSMALGAFFQMREIMSTVTRVAPTVLFSWPLYLEIRRHARVEESKLWAELQPQAARLNRFVDSLMGCWDVKQLKLTQWRLTNVDMKLLKATEDKAAKMMTALLLRFVELRIEQLQLGGAEYARFHGEIDVSAVARGRHIVGAVDEYFNLKSADMTQWSEKRRERYRRYYHSVASAAASATRAFNGSLDNYSVRRDYRMIEGSVELPDEVDTRNIFWDVSDPEIKSAGVSVPQSRGVDAKVRVVLPDSFTLRYNLTTAWELNNLFEDLGDGSLWDHLVQSVRYRYLGRIGPRLMNDESNTNRNTRTKWLDSNVVVAIGMVGELNRYFDSFNRHSAEASSHSMLSWQQFGNGSFALGTMGKFGVGAHLNEGSDPEKMHISAIIVRVYALPSGRTDVGHPATGYERSYQAIRGRLAAVNRRTSAAGDVLFSEPLINQWNLSEFFNFVQRNSLARARDENDERKRASALAAVARQLGLAGSNRKRKIKELEEKIAAAKLRLSQYRRLRLAIRKWGMPSAFDAAENDEELANRQELFAALYAFGPEHVVYKEIIKTKYSLQVIGYGMEDMMAKSQVDIDKYTASLKRLKDQEPDEEKKRQVDEEKKARVLAEEKALNEERKRAEREAIERARKMISELKDAEEKQRQRRQRGRAGDRIAALARRLAGPGKFDEKAIVLANHVLGKDWFQRQFQSSIYVPILNRTDNLCLYWAVSLQLHKLHAHLKGKKFTFGAWTGAKPKLVEGKEEKKDSDTDSDTEMVVSVFEGRDPDSCKPWKKACYKLLRDLEGPMAGPALRPKFPDDVIRLSEMIGYPIAVIQTLPSGKIRVVLDTAAHAPQTAALKKRIAREVKKAKERDVSFAAALNIDPGLPPELKSGYQMTNILPNSEHIVLFYSGKPALHFDLIKGKEIGRFMERSQTDKDRLCRHCMDIYKIGTSHKCVYARCDRCHKNNCPTNFLTNEQYYGAEKMECDQCWLYFLTDTCFANHKKRRKGAKYSVCDMYKYCKECSVFYKAVVRVGGSFKENKVIYQHNTDDGKSGHVHRGEVCQQCNDIMERGHECMFAKIKLPDPLYHHIGVYDTESVQPDGVHQTCLVVYSEGLATVPQHEYRKFKEMKDKKMVKSIADYHPTERKEKSRYVASVATENRTAAEVFVDRMLAIRQERKEWAKDRKQTEDLKRVPASNFTMLGFNSSGYDLPLLMSALCHNSEGLNATVTYHGTRLLKLVLARGPTAIKFIDAGRFIPGSLARTVKTFGLEPELKAIGEPVTKGVAPFFFLQPDYVGTFPDKICFPTKDRRQAWFNDWYEEESKKFMPHTEIAYDYMEELIKYCTQDTRILGLAVAAFREQFLKATNRTLDPFCYTTLTSACMAYYSAHHMPEHSIANLAAKVNRALRRGLYGGRVECPRMLFPVPECKTAPSAKTNYRQFSKRAYLIHLDFTSLYPSVLVDGLFPWGHACWFLRAKSRMQDAKWNEKEKKDWDDLYEPLRDLDCVPYCEDLDLDDVEDVLARFLQPGSCTMILCDYHAPDNLATPVFPSRTEKGGNRYDLLEHSFQMVNSVELRVALREGYTVDFIYAVAYWRPESCSTELFTSYYTKFVAQKDQCSGWPAGCDTEEKKSAYLRAYREHPKNHNTELDPSMIEDNPGGREINKFAINSHWGRYAMADDHPHTAIYDMESAKSRLAFYDTLFNVDRNHCLAAPTVISSPDGAKAKVQLTYRKVDETKKEIEKGSPTNVAIGIFTTAYARMRLYEELKKLAPGRIFYLDTDSLTLVVDPEMKNVPVEEGQLRWDELPSTGSMLGQLKWEPKPGYKIRYYGSTGRKSYQEFGTYTDEAWEKYLQLKAEGKEQPDCVCNKSPDCPAFLHAKVVTKGLPETPNAEFAYQFTRVSLARKILGLEPPNPYECHFSLLKRVPAKQAVHTIPTVRKYRLFNENCVLAPDGRTLPHGHCMVNDMLEGWEESAESVREMLADAEECLERVAHKAVGYQFAYSSIPGWFDPEHPEHKEKMDAWERRQAKRERLHKEHEERIKLEEQLANQIEDAARAEGQRQQELLDEAGEQLLALQAEIDRQDAEHEAAIQQYDESKEEELDPNDNEANYAVGDEEPESNPLIADQAEGEGPGHEDEKEELNALRYMMDETVD